MRRLFAADKLRCGTLARSTTLVAGGCLRSRYLLGAPTLRQQLLELFVLCVVEGADVERRGHLVEQRLRDPSLGLAGAVVPRRKLHPLVTQNLVGVAKEHQYQSVAVRFEHREVLAGTQHDPRDADLAARLERRSQQCVRMLPALLGRHVVRAIVEDDVDIGGVGELDDVDSLGALRVQPCQLLVGNDRVAASLVFVTVNDTRPGNLCPVELAYVLAEDTTVVIGVEQVQREAAAGSACRHEPHRDGHQAEAKHAGPRCAASRRFVVDPRASRRALALCTL